MDEILKKHGIIMTILLLINFVLGCILLFPDMSRNKISIASGIGTFLFFISVFGIIFWWMVISDSYNEYELIKGENRKIRKQKKKILKLEAHKNYLENKKERKEQILNLNCRINNLKLEIKGKQTVCEQCGSKINRNACYCSQCSAAVNKYNEKTKNL